MSASWPGEINIKPKPNCCDLLGSPMGDPGALPGEEAEDRGDLVDPTARVFSLHLLKKNRLFVDRL